MLEHCCYWLGPELHIIPLHQRLGLSGSIGWRPLSGFMFRGSELKGKIAAPESRGQKAKHYRDGGGEGTLLSALEAGALLACLFILALVSPSKCHHSWCSAALRLPGRESLGSTLRLKVALEDTNMIKTRELHFKIDFFVVVFTYGDICVRGERYGLCACERGCPQSFRKGSQIL